MKTEKNKPSEGQINIIVCMELKLVKEDSHPVQIGLYNSDTKQAHDIVFSLKQFGVKNEASIVENVDGIYLVREDGSKLSAVGKQIGKRLDRFFTNNIPSSCDRLINLMFYSQVEMEFFGKLYFARILEHDNLVFTCFQHYVEKKGDEFKPLDKHLNLSEQLYSAKKQCFILKDTFLSEYETNKCLFTSFMFPLPTTTIQNLKVDEGFSLKLSCCQIQTDRSAWVPRTDSQEKILILEFLKFLSRQQ